MNRDGIRHSDTAKEKEQWIFGHFSNNIAIFTIILILAFRHELLFFLAHFSIASVAVNISGNSH